jgi:hypothetical protein
MRYKGKWCSDKGFSSYWKAIGAAHAYSSHNKLPQPFPVNLDELELRATEYKQRRLADVLF